MGVWGPTAPAWYFLLLPRPPVFLARRGGSALFFLRRWAAVKVSEGAPQGFALTDDRGAVSFRRVPLRAKKAVALSSIKSAPWMGAELRACAAQGWRSGGRRVTDARRFNNIIYHYIT